VKRSWLVHVVGLSACLGILAAAPARAQEASDVVCGGSKPFFEGRYYKLRCNRSCGQRADGVNHHPASLDLDAVRQVVGDRPVDAAPYVRNALVTATEEQAVCVKTDLGEIVIYMREGRLFKDLTQVTTERFETNEAMREYVCPEEPHVEVEKVVREPLEATKDRDRKGYAWVTCYYRGRFARTYVGERGPFGFVDDPDPTPVAPAEAPDPPPVDDPEAPPAEEPDAPPADDPPADPDADHDMVRAAKRLDLTTADESDEGRTVERIPERGHPDFEPGIDVHRRFVQRCRCFGELPGRVECRPFQEPPPPGFGRDHEPFGTVYAPLPDDYRTTELCWEEKRTDRPPIPEDALDDPRLPDRELPLPPRPSRQALVVGNASYANLPQLEGTQPDAATVANALGDLGFDVLPVFDADATALEAAFETFLGKAGEAQITFVYFAGHGLQIAGTNLLLPIDTDPAAPTYAPMLSDWIERLAELEVPQNIVAVDACRTNEEGGGEPGLAALPAQPDNFVVAYAAEPGHVAYDDGGFADALADAIRTPGQDFGQTLDSIVETVQGTTEAKPGGVQTPWTSTTTDLSEICLFGPCQWETELAVPIPEVRVLNRVTVTKRVRDLAFSPDGERLAIAMDNRVRVYPTGSAVPELELPSGARRVGFTFDGKEVVTFGSALRRWDEEGRSKGAYSERFRYAELSGDGRFAVTYRGNQAGIWDTASGGKVASLRRNPYGNFQVSVNPATSQPTLDLGYGKFDRLVLSHDGSRALVRRKRESTWELWDVPSATVIDVLPIDMDGIPKFLDGRDQIVIGVPEYALFLYDLRAKRRLRFQGGERGDPVVAVSSRARIVGTADEYTWRLWDGTNRVLIEEGTYEDRQIEMAISSLGDRVAIADGTEVVVYEVVP